MAAMKAGLALLALLAAAAVVEAGSAAGIRPNYAELARREQQKNRRSLTEDYRKYTQDDLGEKPGPSDNDDDCGEWKVGTATGYSTDGTDKGDKPMAPNDLGEWVVPGKFFKARNVVAIDGGDWESDKYHKMEVCLEGKCGTLYIWDVCRDKDCAEDNENCCSNNKKEFTNPEDSDDSGYLVDVETHAAKDLWGLEGAHNWLVAPVWYRICGKFDHKEDVEKYDMECTGLEGDGKCD